MKLTEKDAKTLNSRLGQGDVMVGTLLREMQEQIETLTAEVEQIKQSGGDN
jgi:hypothetical protein